MSKNPQKLIIIFILLVLSLICIYLQEIGTKLKEIDNNLSIISDELMVTKGILNGHITNTLSLDYGGDL